LEQAENSSANNKNRFLKIVAEPRYIFIFATVVILLVFVILRGANTEKLVTYQRVMLDTVIELRFETVNGTKGDEIADNVYSALGRLEKLFSRSLPASDVSRLNAQAGLKPVSVSQEVLFVAEQAVYYSEISGGAFDPTVAPLIDLWGFLGQEYRLPGEEEIEEALTLVDYRMLLIDRERNEIYLPDQSMALELGGIAKGYIVDKALTILKEAGIKTAFVNAGGDIGLIGSRPDGTPWRIGVRHPRDQNKVIAVLQSKDGAVVTSGDYERSFEVDGESYHHILDPKSGMPAVQLASVTIVAETAIAADALSTTVFVLGPAEGLALIERLPGVEGVLITPDLEIIVSSGLSDLIEIDQ